MSMINCSQHSFATASCTLLCFIALLLLFALESQLYSYFISLNSVSNLTVRPLYFYPINYHESILTAVCSWLTNVQYKRSTSQRFSSNSEVEASESHVHFFVHRTYSSLEVRYSVYFLCKTYSTVFDIIDLSK